MKDGSDRESTLLTTRAGARIAFPMEFRIGSARLKRGAQAVPPAGAGPRGPRRQFAALMRGRARGGRMASFTDTGLGHGSAVSGVLAQPDGG
jgi:hypothetical protein